MKEYYYHLKTGITRTPEFERKGLATHAVNVGSKCSHDCCYCSSPSLLRCHQSFKKVGEHDIREAGSTRNHLAVEGAEEAKMDG